MKLAGSSYEIYVEYWVILNNTCQMNNVINREIPGAFDRYDEEIRMKLKVGAG